ncbi:mucin-12-like [Mizuhopecten yessoensis]|uniref:mucin-12-like n=1 Tax=Mizuhopecten yessoensis TaxID=6573 RepID=UPI000B459390|nr:mucin-12-like [Mizuhopecten yessoensis]
MPTWSNIQSTFSDKMDFHAAMETFAEAWVAANTPTAVNSTEPQPQVGKQNSDDLPTLLTKEQLASKQSPPPSSSPSSPVSPVQLSPPSHAHTTKGHSHTPTGHTAIGQPPVGHTHSTTGHTSPTTGHSHPTTGHTQQTTGYNHPTTGNSNPTTGHTHPTTGHTHPTTGHTHLTTGHTHSTTGHTHSTTGLTHPTAGYNHPTSQSHSTGGHTHKKPDPIPVTGHTPQTPNPAPVSSVTPAGTKSLPVHCIIEQTTGVVTFDTPECGSNSSVELDSYAILPSTTLFGEVVRTALIKLGYNPSEAISAKGAVQIKNWRPLTFEVITDDEKATLEDIWGELTQVATLRIRLSSQSKLSSTDEVKSKLLQLLLTQSHGLLLTSGCPIEKSLLSSITKGDTLSSLPHDVRCAFDKWYDEQVEKAKKSQEQNGAPEDLRSPEKALNGTINGTVAAHENHFSNSPANHSPPLTSLTGLNHGKTRMRTSFDPEHEIPRLQKWFAECQHPTREQMIRFLEELNKLESRKGRRPLDLTNIIYWFKNARAAHRRASRNFDDNSFEMEEGLENSPVTIDRNVPYLPNKNAVYIVPYPYHGPFMSHDSSHDQSKEPCDLSQSRRPVSSPDIKKEKDLCDSKSDSADEEVEAMDTMETHQEKSPVSIKEETPDLGDGECVTDLIKGVKDDVDRISMGEREAPQSNGMHMSDSEDDDDMESDYEEQSNEDSESSHKLSSLSYNKDFSEADYLSNHISRMPTTPTSGLHQPLHIPHFPHPLAMHYFPMNTHFMAQQSAAARLQHHQHQQQQQSQHPHHKASPGNAHRKRRTRVFIDPMTEIPKLEKWFTEDTHPSSYMIDKYCEDLNRSDYRQKFPKLEPKNVQLWFKNHRAKVKRMRVTSHLD